MPVDFTVGIDEAGRGPLAGPLVVAAVQLPLNSRLGEACRVCGEVTDSKQLSAEKREVIYRCLTTHVDWAYTFVTPRFIDRYGLRPALDTAVARVLRRLAVSPAKTLVKLDGSLAAPAYYLNQETIIRGDISEPEISAASIIAKVRRDRMMVRYDRCFPEYGLARHKGYGTYTHRQAIRRHGPSLVHRRSFLSRLTED